MTLQELKTLNMLDKVWLNEYKRPGIVVGMQNKAGGDIWLYVKYDLNEQGERIEQFELDKVEIYDPMIDY